MDQNYISLSEAAKLTNYSQDYISLLCRQKKLKGTKIGRNWVTTKQWLEEYTEKTKGKNIVSNKTKKSKKIKVRKNKIINKKKAYLPIDYDSLSAFELQNRASSFAKFMSVLFLVFAFFVNLLFFQSWSSSLDNGLAGSKIDHNSTIKPIIEKSIITEKNHQGRVAGTEDDNEIYSNEDKFQTEVETQTEIETEEDEKNLYTTQQN